jgi:FAD/FMN-containing dehydrogenase
MRPYGLSADNLRSVDVVTADGHGVTANGDEHPDLYWALQGGGGNFGIATSLDFDLHQVGPTVLAGPIFFALEDAPAVVAFYRDWIASSPDALTTILNFRRAPTAAFLPPKCTDDRSWLSSPASPAQLTTANASWARCVHVPGR